MILNYKFNENEIPDLAAAFIEDSQQGEEEEDKQGEDVRWPARGQGVQAKLRQGQKVSTADESTAGAVIDDQCWEEKEAIRESEAGARRREKWPQESGSTECHR